MSVHWPELSLPCRCCLQQKKWIQLKKSHKIVYYCAANVECEQCNFLYLSLASKAVNVCFTISYFICIISYACFHILYVYNIRERKLLNLNVEIILVHTSSTKRQELQSADLKKEHSGAVMEKHGEAKALPGGGHTILSNSSMDLYLKIVKI